MRWYTSAMSDLQSREQLDEMRKRLYSRGFDVPTSQRHDLIDRKVDVARNWGTPTDPLESPAETPTAPVVPHNVAPATDTDSAEEHVSQDSDEPHHRFRRFAMIGSLAIFIVVAVLSSAFLYFGGNQISSDNIDITVAGPGTVNGGDTMTLQIGITNQNTVGIESTTLVLKYPSGIRTTEEPITTLNEQRISIETLAPGEARNVAIPIGIFGRENEQKQIQATLEYRIVNSNGTFYKDAEPFNFQITSSPLILQVTSIKQVAAGQPIDVTITAKSNASAPLKNILIEAVYPNSFVFKSSEPSPIYNQNIWQIEELLPGESFSITLKGSVSGLTEESFGINFTAGLAQANNQYIVGASLAEARSEFTIEKPFIDVGIEIDGDSDRSVVIPSGKQAAVQISIANTLDETVYDMVVEVVPGGSALNSQSIQTRGGFYDSNTGIIRFEPANNSSFQEVRPGDTRTLDFSIIPADNQGAATFDLVVNVFARRVAERNAQEQLIGTVKAEARYASEAIVGAALNLKSGPIPPAVGQTTVYQAKLVVAAGANNMSGAIVTTSLPAYVTWLNDYSGEGAVTYNSALRQIEWRAGNVDANSQKELNFSISILPSTSQVGITPIVINGQELRAVDGFTGTPLSASARPVTAELTAEAGYAEGNGRIINSQ